MIIQPGPVVDFLIENQSVRDPYKIDWVKVTTIGFLSLLEIVTSILYSYFYVG